MASKSSQSRLPSGLPLLPTDWSWMPLAELVQQERGISYGIVQPGDYDPIGIPILRVENVENGRVLAEQVFRVQASVEAKFARSRLRGGEILITLVGAYFGKVAVAPSSIAGFNTARAVAVVPVSNDGQFISLALRSPVCQRFMQDWATTTAQPTLNLADVGRLPIPWPRASERAALAEILAALDNKIELNRQMSATLEAMARALFRNWFVEPEAPSDREDSDGWQVRSLDEIAHFLNGLALQKYPPSDGDTLPVVKIAQLRRGDCSGADRCDAGVPVEYVVKDGDVLFSWSGSLEVDLWCGGVGALNQHLFKVTSTSFPKWFYYLWTLHHLDEFRLIAADKATTMGHIQRKHLTLAKVRVPPPYLLERMTRTMHPLVERLIANRVQSRTLAVLRDTLLPKLLSGELRVEKADQEYTASRQRRDIEYVSDFDREVHRLTGKKP